MTSYKTITQLLFTHVHTHTQNRAHHTTKHNDAYSNRATPDILKSFKSLLLFILGYVKCQAETTRQTFRCS